MGYFDNETGEPMNKCIVCGKEVLGWVDDPDSDFVCEECLEKRQTVIRNVF